MRRNLFAIGICAVGIFPCTASRSQSAAPGNAFHTSPDKWPAPRIYHTGNNQYLEERMELSRIPYAGALPEGVVRSSNQGYGFVTRDLAPGEESEAALIIEVFNERPYLTRMVLSEPYRNFAPEVRWINQKLLYVEVWWGRLDGSYYIFDVEKEEVVIAETFHDGKIAFKQWREATAVPNASGDEGGEPER